jgi:cytochrome c
MKRTYAIYSAIAIALLATGQSWAADGAALYKAKCAKCHGAQGQTSVMKSSPLKGNSRSADDIEQFLLNGASGKKGPHAKAISGLKEDQAKAIADYIKTLQ